MNSPLSPSVGLLTLYREASRVSQSLRNYCGQIISQLPSMEEDGLELCVDRYTDSLFLLDQLYTQITQAEKSAVCPSGVQIECDGLRRSIRADLDRAAEAEQAVRSALERKREESRSALLRIRKRGQLSAYLQTPQMGRNKALFDKRD